MGLKINSDKTKLNCFGKSENEDEVVTKFYYKQVDSFKYLRVILNSLSDEHIGNQKQNKPYQQKSEFIKVKNIFSPY